MLKITKLAKLLFLLAVLALLTTTPIHSAPTSTATDSEETTLQTEAPKEENSSKKIESEEDLMEALDDIMGQLGGIFEDGSFSETAKKMEGDMMELRSGMPTNE
jgi:hypothetical protein